MKSVVSGAIHEAASAIKVVDEGAVNKLSMKYFDLVFDL